MYCEKVLVTSAVVCCVKYVIFEFFKRIEAHGSPLLFSGGQNKSPASSSLEKSIRSFIIPHFYIHHGGTRGWSLPPPTHKTSKDLMDRRFFEKRIKEKKRKRKI